jgi:hypothetical protein
MLNAQVGRRNPTLQVVDDEVLIWEVRSRQVFGHSGSERPHPKAATNFVHRCHYFPEVGSPTGDGVLGLL